MFSEAGAAGMPVIDEDRDPTGIGVKTGGDAAHIPPIAGSEEREEADGGVLGGVRRTRDVLERQPGLGKLLVRHRPPDRARPKPAWRKLEWYFPKHLA